MQCIVTDGARYIRIDPSKKIVDTFDRGQAYVFDNKDKAENVLKNLSKALREYPFRIEDVQDPSMLEAADVDLAYLEDILAEHRRIESVFSKLEILEKESIADLKAADHQCNDLEHIIEITSFNASQGYQLAKQLKLARKARRRAKDRLLVLRYIREKYAGCAEIGKFIRKLETRAYKMRSESLPM